MSTTFEGKNWWRNIQVLANWPKSTDPRSQLDGTAVARRCPQRQGRAQGQALRSLRWSRTTAAADRREVVVLCGGQKALLNPGAARKGSGIREARSEVCEQLRHLD